MEGAILKNIINPNCQAVLLIVKNDFSEKTQYFFELNLFFDGLLNQLLKSEFKHQRINVFKTQNYNNDLTLVVVKHSDETWKADKASIKSNFLVEQPEAEIVLIDPHSFYKNSEADLAGYKINKLNLVK